MINDVQKMILAVHNSKAIPLHIICATITTFKSVNVIRHKLLSQLGYIK